MFSWSRQIVLTCIDSWIDIRLNLLATIYGNIVQEASLLLCVLIKIFIYYRLYVTFCSFTQSNCCISFPSWISTCFSGILVHLSPNNVHPAPEDAFFPLLFAKKVQYILIFNTKLLTFHFPLSLHTKHDSIYMHILYIFPDMYGS